MPGGVDCTGLGVTNRHLSHVKANSGLTFLLVARPFRPEPWGVRKRPAPEPEAVIAPTIKSVTVFNSTSAEDRPQ